MHTKNTKSPLAPNPPEKINPPSPVVPGRNYGLTLAIPEGVDPDKVEARKRVLMDNSYGTELGGSLIAESIALQAELQQVASDRRRKSKEEAARNPEPAAAAIPDELV